MGDNMGEIGVGVYQYLWKVKTLPFLICMLGE